MPHQAKPWKSIRSPAWCPSSPSSSTTWLQPRQPTTGPPPQQRQTRGSLRMRRTKKGRVAEEATPLRQRTPIVRVTLRVTAGIPVMTMRLPKKKSYRHRWQPQQLLRQLPQRLQTCVRHRWPPWLWPRRLHPAWKWLHCDIPASSSLL